MYGLSRFMDGAGFLFEEGFYVQKQTEEEQQPTGLAQKAMIDLILSRL
jgi:hypothetical protein